MRILGIMMVRNGEDRIEDALNSMALCCDAVCVLDDRSVDRTPTILRTHRVVTSILTADASLSQEDWFFSESQCLNILYRMADFVAPDWIISVDHDQVIEPASKVKAVLSSLGTNVAAVKTPCISVWNDQQYPLMVPLISQATSLQTKIWRYYPGLVAGSKPLHNGSSPRNVTNFGEIKIIGELAFYHHGWETLQKRITTVDLYTSLDPSYAYNFGVPYDRGLLFGYKRDAIEELIRDYRIKLRQYERQGKAFLSGKDWASPGTQR
jgi:hypothetical protein